MGFQVTQVTRVSQDSVAQVEPAVQVANQDSQARQASQERIRVRVERVGHLEPVGLAERLGLAVQVDLVACQAQLEGRVEEERRELPGLAGRQGHLVHQVFLGPVGFLERQASQALLELERRVLVEPPVRPVQAAGLQG